MFLSVKPMSMDSFKSRVQGHVRANSDGWPILVVDDIQVASNLRALLRAAKFYADKRLVKIVLVISSGEVVRQMLTYSSISRATVCVGNEFFCIFVPLAFLIRF